MPHWNGTANLSRSTKWNAVLSVLWLLCASHALATDGRGVALIEVSAGVVAVLEDGQCSLIEALENAQAAGTVHADCAPGSALGTMISLAPESSYTLHAAYDDDAGPTGLPTVTNTIVIEGNEAIIQRSNEGIPPFRLLRVAVTGDLTLRDLTLGNGVMADPTHIGAGILNEGTLLAERLFIHSASNSIGGGGAIANATGASLHLTHSSLSNNGGPGAGAGLLNAGGAVATVTHSVLATNGCGSPGCGIHNSGELTVINTTLSGNSGPIANGLYNSGTAVVEHVTLAANAGGTPHTFFNSGQATLRNTIIAGTAADIDSCSGAPLGFEGNNLIEDASCGCADSAACMTGDPLLDVLADNGGPTRTHALHPDSIAVDAADGLYCPADDQRGEPRPQGDGCDLGAYERVTPAGIPALVFDPDSVDFGTVTVGDPTAAHTVTLHNEGNGPTIGLTFQDVSMAGYSVDHADCGEELPAAAACSISIVFTAPEAGTFNTMLVASSSGHPPGLLSLTGIGVLPDPPVAEVQPETLTVTLQQEENVTLALTIGNTGEADLSWTVSDDPVALPGEIAQFSGNVLAAQEWDDGSGATLYIGGAFATIDGEPFGGVARWDGASWQPLGSGVSGVTQVAALTVFEGDLIAGGNFTSADGQPAFRVARWDGTNWSPVGTETLSTGMNGAVNALTVYDGELIAAGVFSNAGGQTVNRIARWDGVSWQPLGSGILQTVHALAVFNGDLIAAGAFTQAGGQPASRIARWDGGEWSALGSGVNSLVLRLAVFDGDLYAGGGMSLAGGVPVNNIARWDGEEWSALGAGTSGQVRALTVRDDGLVVAGRFDEAGNGAVNNIARWDGENWSPLGSGITLSTISMSIETLAPWQDRLVAAGNFSETGDGVAVDRIAVWDDSAWQPLAQNVVYECEQPAWVSTTPVSGSVAGGEQQTIEVGFSATGRLPGEYLANLCLLTNDPQQALHIVPLSMTVEALPQPEITVAPDHFDVVLQQGMMSAETLTIENLGEGDLDWLIPEDFAQFNRRVYALATWDDGDGSALYVGGELTNEFGGIARWDGTSWLPLGSGLGPVPSARSVRAMVQYQGQLIVAGTFLEAGGTAVNRIARWDGSRWWPLGEGLGGTVNQGAMVVHGDELIVGGNFTQAGGVDANFIARWDGNQWHPLGTGTNGQVAALAVHDGRLIAGGVFTMAGGAAASRIAAWDGDQWAPLGDGFDSTVLALGLFDDELIAAGAFSGSGDLALNRIARWDGSAWSGLGAGLGGQIYAVREFDGELLAAGLGEPSIYRWNAGHWLPLGGGMANVFGAAVVEAMQELDGALFVGGRFTHAGGTQAFDIARWDGAGWSALVAEPAACLIPEWLEVSPRSGTLVPGDDAVVVLGFDTRNLAPGDYETTLCVVHNDPSRPMVQVPVTLNVTEPPVADITPDAFAFELTQGDSADDVLHIGNSGPVDLDWHIGHVDPEIVIYDQVNFTVPMNATGGSVRWDTGQTCDCDDPWLNFNIWLSATFNQMAFFWPAGGVSANAGGVSDGGTHYAVLEPGAMVGPGAPFIDNISPAGTEHWRQPAGVDGYLGFRFFNDHTQTVNYGYARIRTTGVTGHPATIVGWSYNQAGNPISVLPLTGEGCDDPAEIAWLDVSAATGSTPPQSTVQVDLTVDTASLQPGEYHADLCVYSNDPINRLVVVPVSLSVTEVPVIPGVLEVEPQDVDFGEVPSGAMAVVEVTVANGGPPDAQDLQLTAIDLTGDAAFAVIGGSCSPGQPLPAQHSCTVAVRFNPDAQAGFSGLLSVATADDQHAAVNLSGTGTPAVDPTAAFQGLGYFGGEYNSSTVGGVSADGQVVAGRSHTPDGVEAFRWENGQLHALGVLPGGFVSSRADAASADGSVLVGMSSSANAPQEAFRWHDGTMTALGDLPGGSFNSAAFDVSDDGLVVVGQAVSDQGIEAFRWEDGVMQGLGDLDGGGFNSTAYAISGDGRVIVGRATSDDGTEAFRWEDGVMAGLGVLPGAPFHNSQAEGVSADGSVVVGISSSPEGSQAFRWADGVLEGLGRLPGDGWFFSAARDVSADGRVVVGESNIDSETEAFYWTAEDGMRNLKEMLEHDHGLNLYGWELRGATSVSADGNVMVGYGINPDGDFEAWRAELFDKQPEPQPGIVQITPLAHAFGKIELGQSAEVEITVANAADAGAAALRLLQPEIVGDSAFTIVGGDCAVATLLEPGQSCTVVVGFAPQAKGSWSGELQIATEDGQSATSQLSGTGTVTQQPENAIYADRFETAAGS